MIVRQINFIPYLLQWERERAVERPPDHKGDKMTLKEKKKKFLELYQKNMCNLSKTARIMKVPRSTVYGWFVDETFHQEYKDAKENLIDDLESEIWDQIFNKHNLVATIFALKCMGKKRGWYEKVETITKEMKPIRVFESHPVQKRTKKALC